MRLYSRSVLCSLSERMFSWWSTSSRKSDQPSTENMVLTMYCSMIRSTR